MNRLLFYVPSVWLQTLRENCLPRVICIKRISPAQARMRRLPRPGLGASCLIPGDPHDREILPVAALALGILPAALLERNHFRSALLLHDLASHAGALDEGCTQSLLTVSRQHENVIEGHSIPRLAGKRHDGDRLPCRDAILLAAGFNDCEQFHFPRLKGSCRDRPRHCMPPADGYPPPIILPRLHLEIRLAGTAAKTTNPAVHSRIISQSIPSPQVPLRTEGDLGVSTRQQKPGPAV